MVMVTHESLAKWSEGPHSVIHQSVWSILWGAFSARIEHKFPDGIIFCWHLSRLLKHSCYVYYEVLLWCNYFQNDTLDCSEGLYILLLMKKTRFLPEKKTSRHIWISFEVFNEIIIKLMSFFSWREFMWLCFSVCLPCYLYSFLCFH